jgi:hypothetical protein
MNGDLITIVNAKKQRDSRQGAHRFYADLLLRLLSDTTWKNSNVKLITRRLSKNYGDKYISNGRDIRKRSKCTSKRKRKYQRHNETDDDATGNYNEQPNDDNVKKQRKKTRGTDTRNTTTVHTNKYNYKQLIRSITTIYKRQQTKM